MLFRWHQKFGYPVDTSFKCQMCLMSLLAAILQLLHLPCKHGQHMLKNTDLFLSQKKPSYFPFFRRARRAFVRAASSAKVGRILDRWMFASRPGRLLQNVCCLCLPGRLKTELRRDSSETVRCTHMYVHDNPCSAASSVVGGSSKVSAV